MIEKVCFYYQLDIYRRRDENYEDNYFVPQASDRSNLLNSSLKKVQRISQWQLSYSATFCHIRRI